MGVDKTYFPRRDTVFTAMFLNKELCEMVLEVVLGEKVELVDILSECENNMKKAALNSIFFDIKTRTVDNKIITIDLQRKYQKERISNRSIYYAAREIANQKVIKGKYEELNNVIITFILTEAPREVTRKHRKVKLIDENTGEIFSELLTLHEISLNCIDKTDGTEMKIIKDFFDIMI